MGTTLEVCLIYNNKVYIGHIGDSRIYRIRSTFIRKLTKDHSYVEQLVTDGTITKEEAINHPKKNITNMVKEQEIYDYVKEDINNATDKLVQRANEMGGYDNITVIVIQNN